METWGCSFISSVTANSLLDHQLPLTFKFSIETDNGYSVAQVVIRSDRLCQIINVCNRPIAAVQISRKRRFNAEVTGDDAKSAGAPDRDAPNAKIKCVITRVCRACFGSNAAWALGFEVAASAPCANAPTYQRSIASVARLLRGDDRDRPGSREPVVTHGVITGAFKHGTIVEEAGINIAGYGIPGRNCFGTDTKCA